MVEVIATVQPQYLLAGGMLVGLIAVALSRPGAMQRLWRVRWTIALPILAALGGLGFTGALWLIAPHIPASLTRTYAAPRSCAEARAMGYGTARIGQPGYFRHLDGDGDGISCEPLPRSGPRY